MIRLQPSFSGSPPFLLVNFGCVARDGFYFWSELKSNTNLDFSKVKDGRRALLYQATSMIKQIEMKNQRQPVQAKWLIGCSFHVMALLSSEMH